MKKGIGCSCGVFVWTVRVMVGGTMVFTGGVGRGRGGLWCISGTTQIAIQLATGVATGVEQTTMVALS